MRSVNRALAAVARPVAAAVDALDRQHRLTLVGWHRIDDGPGGLSTSFDDFRRHLDALDAWGARVLPLDDAVRLLAKDELPERAVALTFDDGYASVLELAWPELRSRGLPATLFAVSGYLDGGRRLPWDRHHPAGDRSVELADRDLVRAAAATGLAVGSHTVTHRWLPALSPQEAARELRDSKAALEELLDREVSALAYPMGGWSPALREAAGAAGYQIGITVERGRNGVGHDPLALRRAFAFDRADDFRRQLEGAFTWMRPVERWRTGRGPR